MSAVTTFNLIIQATVTSFFKQLVDGGNEIFQMPRRKCSVVSWLCCVAPHSRSIVPHACDVHVKKVRPFELQEQIFGKRDIKYQKAALAT